MTPDQLETVRGGVIWVLPRLDFSLSPPQRKVYDHCVRERGAVFYNPLTFGDFSDCYAKAKK